jgi:hypothetical protein
MKNTIENNKLILTFMGIKPRLISPDVYSYSDQPFFYTDGSIDKVLDNMCQYAKYDKDWNWLMKVIERIESMDFVVTICYLLAEITNEDLGQRETPLKTKPIYFSCNNGGTKIEVTYNACISFIKWYNENKTEA